MSDVTPFEQVKRDLENAIRANKETNYIDAKKIAANWLYPLFQSMLEAVDERFQEIEDVVSEFVSPTESMILPELTQRIITALGVGQRLATIASLVVSLGVDEDTQKAINEILENNGTVQEWYTAFTAECQALATELQEVTIEEVNEDEDESEEEEEEDAEVEESDEEEEAE